jgi:hypothetical protein
MDVVKMMWFGVAAVAIWCCGVACAWCQMLPPPPAVQVSSDGFTDKDRSMLRRTYLMTRAIHTKMFPMQLDQRLLDSGNIDISP